MTTEYFQLLDAVEQYYGSGSDQWLEIAKYGITSDKAESILSQVPGVNIVKNSNGKIRSYNFNTTENVVSATETAVNSNTSPILKSFDVPANTGLETVTTPAGETVKQMTFKSGVSQAGNFVFGEILPAVGATAVGITLGKTIDKLLYEVNPDFWDEHGMGSLNPDTWNTITGNDTLGGRIFNTVFGLNPDNGNTQMYMDENAFAYMAMYLKNIDAFNVSYEATNNTVDGIEAPYNIQAPIPFTISNYAYYGGDYRQEFNIGTKCLMLVRSYNATTYEVTIASGSIEPYTNTTILVSNNIHISIDNATKEQINNKVFYSTYDKSFISKDKFNPNLPYLVIPDNSNISGGKIADLMYILLFGNISTTSINGIGTQDNAKTPDLSNANTIEEALDTLKEQYPELFEKAINQDVVQPDGSTITYTYVPVSMPEIDPSGNPISSTSTQAIPDVDPDTAPDSLLDTITGSIENDPPINPPDTGKGNTPAVVTPTGSASALYAIYNPTIEQINSFGSWLWSSDFVEQIKKLFNDPMQAIIGLHKVYATPATNGTQNIKVGYLDSGVPSNVVSNQYTTIDCGTVSLSEYFYNVFDYAPYTDINLYLPFIGIVGLDVADVMRSSINIIYHVDVLSGACLAEVKVIRDSAGGTVYQYTGNASVTLPISSGSYMGIISSIAGIAGGIAGTIASGGSALPLLASSAGSLLNARTKVEHSGGFSGNAGAMGIKIPYLIISRPQVDLANKFERYIGYPANITTTLASCSGFVNVLECHLENIKATDSELNEIESLLKGGIIV